MNDQEKLHEEHCCCGHDHEHEHEHHHDHDCCDYEHEHHHDHDCCGHDHEHHHHDGCCDDDDDDCCCGHSCSCAACSGEEKEAGAKDIILLVISVALVGASFLIPQGPHGIFRLLVQAVATLLVGWELFWKGLKGLLRFSLDETTLMTIAVVAAFAIGEGFEGAMVTILYQIGEYFEDRAVMNSRKRIDALVSIVPENANLLNPDGSVTEVPASQLEPGDLLLVRAGDRIPLDCEVLEGEGQVDTAAITGESIPVSVSNGSELLSGMINLTAALKCRATKRSADSAASKIADLVKEATQKKSKTERFITRFSRWYTPAVVIAAVLLAVLPPIFGAGAFSEWLHRALIFLVASCPCALVISVPLTFYSVIGAASKKGALIKGSSHVEALSKIENVVFDKTGTLTTGNLSVQEIRTLSDLPEEEILRLAAICESASAHPIAKAVTARYGAPTSPDSSEEISGKGVKAQINGKTYYCGSARLLKDAGISLDGAPESGLYLADETALLGCIQVGDTVKPEAAEALKELKAMGVRKTVMLTGDRAQAAETVRAALGVDEARSNLLPQDKVSALQEIRKSGPTAFVGDGINDGPVLAAADVGVAMGMGSDLAAQAADVVLPGNRLTSIPAAIRAARKGMKIANENIVFILIVKAAVLILGALGLAPMWAAVFADVGTALLAVLNAMRVARD